MWPQWKQVEKPQSTLSLGRLLSPHSPLIKRALSTLFLVVFLFFGGVRWAFCPIIAEWIQLVEMDMLTKLCFTGLKEMTCATWKNEGLITEDIK